MGAMAGLGLALAAFVAIGLTGFADALAGAGLLILMQYAAQVGAGYVSGRLSGGGRVLHGGLAGLLMAAVGAAIGLGFAGADANLPLIVVALMIAATCGSAGGAFAEFQART